MTQKATACILCSQNCGITIDVDDQGVFSGIKGDPKHPVSEGYLCQKATRLNFYQNQERLTSPLKRKEDGSFEEISWDQAIAEIAQKLVDIRDTHSGKSIAYVGGGGQGNHLVGAYGGAFRAACQTPYIYSALAQEKTGNFWVNGHLFGRQNLNYCEAVDEADYVMIIGANPVQSHGIPKARPTINALSRNKERTLLVIDPRETETAKKADVFLQVKPGKDAYLLAAMLGVIVQEGLEDQDFIKTKTTGFEQIRPHFEEIPVEDFSTIAGIDAEQVRKIARDIAAAPTFAIRSDLGIEHSLNSTLNAYLSRLLFLITGNFGKEGTNCLHSNFIPVIGHSKAPEEGGETTQVTGMRGIAKLFPPNILPLEIDTDHPKRLRAVIVDSSNPLANYPDTHAQQKAFEKLELSVCIEVAMTETAQACDYILPASTQFEKMEATFFNLEFPDNFFHLRHPITEAHPNTLPEPEIYHRLATAMGEVPAKFPTLAAIAKLDRRMPGLKLFPLALGLTLQLKPKWKKSTLFVLKETLGKALPFPDAKVASLIWVGAHRYAKRYPEAVRRTGIKGSGYALGEALFNKILNSPSGTLVSKHNHEESWNMIRHKDKKVHLNIPKMLSWLDQLPEKARQEALMEQEYPFNLMAGERRSYNANGIMRNPEWRKKDISGLLKVNPEDAEKLGITEGDRVRCSSEAGEIEIKVTLSSELKQGLLSMPHGYGFSYGAEKDKDVLGVMPNLLTSLKDCDPLAKTPYHKHVRVRLERIEELTATAS